MVDPILRVRREAGAWYEMDGEIVLLVVETGAYLGLNPSATVLWGMLADGATRDELVDALHQVYGLDAERATLDVQTFLDTCARHGLLAA